MSSQPMHPSLSYCASRLATRRRSSVEVKVGTVGVGGANPIRIQSMTTSDTQDVEATVRQSIELAEVGCEIVRVTAPNVAAAAALKDIRTRFSAAGFAHIPLVADIHFLPQAAMEAVEHVEKIRVNPGNYADKKKFAVKEYSDSEYNRELERLHIAFSPLVKRCRELGRSLRIGTNHGSLSDRILNRYGDTPLGMVESALEFVRICEDNGFHDIILSMKASNPKVVIQAYRLLVSRMDQQHRAYPLHLGVTEAGDGEDGRIKSAIGIGALLMDGIGDTIRVSLTEDSVREIPVARALAAKAMRLWQNESVALPAAVLENVDPFRYQKREVRKIALGAANFAGGDQPPRVIAVLGDPERPELGQDLRALLSPSLKDTPAEAIAFSIKNVSQLARLPSVAPAALVLDLQPTVTVQALGQAATEGNELAGRLLQALEKHPSPEGSELKHGFLFPFGKGGEVQVLDTLADLSPAAADDKTAKVHSLGRYRRLVAQVDALNQTRPLWIRCHAGSRIEGSESEESVLLESSMLAGALLCEGRGDFLSVEMQGDPVRSMRLAYNILQGSGARITKTEYVACPSCGRTLFDLQSTTQRIRAITGHLKGVKIAIMGCIVNGPGEMADADFGYVGGAPGKINLYVGKNCVQFNIDQKEADSRLVALIKEHGKWTEPESPVTSP